MRDRTHTLPIFIVCLVSLLLLIVLGRFGFVQFIPNTLQQIFFPLAKILHEKPQTSSQQLLLNENANLRQQLTHMQQIQADNVALRDQFETTHPLANILLPATIVGMPGAIPNVSFPEDLILDKGSSDSIKVGQTAVVKNMLIGVVRETTNHYAVVSLVTSKDSSLSVKDEKTGAIGVGRGQSDGQLLMDNVLLSDTIKVGDTIVSRGSTVATGKGILPGLIVGKIVSVEKNPSSLFQSAEVVPLIPFDRLTTVFFVMP